MEWMVTLHSYFRWVVLVVGIAAIAISLMVSMGKRPWDLVADRLALFFAIAMDIQFLIGVVVWVNEFEMDRRRDPRMAASTRNAWCRRDGPCWTGAGRASHERP